MIQYSLNKWLVEIKGKKMNISELYSLTVWIQEEITDNQVLVKYDELHKVLEQLASSQNTSISFESQKDNLISTISEIPVLSLTEEQFKMLNSLNIAQSINNIGIDNIQDILYKNGLDIVAASKKLSETIKKLKIGIGKSKQINVGLTDCIEDENYEISNDILMRVKFTKDSSMSNITEFKKWGDTWYHIGRGITLAHNLTPEDVKIIGAARGSVIIEMLIVAEIATIVSGIILAVLKVVEKVYDIKKKAEELKALKLNNNDNIIKEIEKSVEEEENNGFNSIASQMTKKLKIKEGDKVNALNKSVEYLIDFINNGGEIDFILPKNEDDNKDIIKENKNLKILFQEIRTMESRIKHLEHKKPEERKE